VNRIGNLERAARIDLMIETYRRAQQRRLMKQAMRLFTRTENDKRRADLETLPTRIH
jgi:hypothetical protein